MTDDYGTPKMMPRPPGSGCPERHPATGEPCILAGDHDTHQAMGVERLQLFGPNLQASESPTLDQDLTEAEQIGLAVATMAGSLIQSREAARDLAVEVLEGQLAEAVKHLRVLVAIVDGTVGTTFAHDTDALTQANEFLEGLGSPETPDETKD